MRKKHLVFIFSLLCGFAFAQEKIDSIMQKVADDVTSKCNSKTILCILDFNSPSKDLSEYIQTELRNFIFFFLYSFSFYL